MQYIYIYIERNNMSMLVPSIIFINFCHAIFLLKIFSHNLYTLLSPLSFSFFLFNTHISFLLIVIRHKLESLTLNNMHYAYFLLRNLVFQNMQVCTRNKYYAFFFFFLGSWEHNLDRWKNTKEKDHSKRATIFHFCWFW